MMTTRGRWKSGRAKRLSALQTASAGLSRARLGLARLSTAALTTSLMQYFAIKLMPKIALTQFYSGSSQGTLAWHDQAFEAFKPCLRHLGVFGETKGPPWTVQFSRRRAPWEV